MAAWQFDFHVLPRGSVTRFYGAIPLAIADEAFDTHNWWTAHPSRSEFEADIASVLPRLASWSPEVERWGTEDGDRIDLVREGGTVGDVLVRVDTRRLSQTFLADLVKVARKHGLLIRLSDGRIIQPSSGKLLSEIRVSNAFRFSEDPRGFIESLGAAARDDLSD